MEYVFEDNQDAGIIVRITGRVDYSAVGAFSGIIETTRELAPKALRLDLAAVTAIDSVGFGLLIMLREAVPAARIALAGAVGAPARLLGLFNASTLFDVVS
jgi:anti-anti-sigma regulatory factor